MLGVTRLIAGIRGIVAKLIVLDEVPQDVDAEAVHAALEPEADDVVHGLAHDGIAPVQIGLRLEERVIVVLTRALVVFPSRAAELTQPVRRRSAAGRRIAPDIPVATWIVAR